MGDLRSDRSETLNSVVAFIGRVIHGSVAKIEAGSGRVGSPCRSPRRNPFKGRQYPGEVILLAVRWYLRYPLAYLHVSEILTERGLFIDASCIWRWVQAYAPELDKRCRPHLKTDKQELPRRRNLYKGQRQRPVSLPCRGLHRPDDRFPADRQTRCRQGRSDSSGRPFSRRAIPHREW